MKPKCVRCETLERKQQSPHIQYVGLVPLCSVCMQEIAEEELFFKIREEETEDESGSESID
jgi:hypothetical protein